MISFRNLPIKYKLTLLSVLASSSALILACVSFVIYDMQTFRAEMVQQLSTQAKIIGYNSAAALLFHDSKSANETLAALSAEPDVVAAGIYSPAGKSFAIYRQNGDESATALPAALQATNKAERRFAGGYLDLRPIIYQGENVGAIHIRASLGAMKTRQQRYIGIAAMVLLISIPASILISYFAKAPAANFPADCGVGRDRQDDIERQGLFGPRHGKQSRRSRPSRFNLQRHAGADTGTKRRVTKSS